MAEKITALYHGEKKASSAKQAFINQFSKGELPEDIETKTVSSKTLSISETLTSAGVAGSKSEVRRLIAQHGIKLDREVVETDIDVNYSEQPKLFQVGKRKFVKITYKK